MSRHARKMPSTVRLSVLTALLAVFMGWLVLGHAALLPWDPRWYLTAHTAMEVFSVIVAMLVFSTGWHGIGRDMPIRVALLSPTALAVGLLDFGHLMCVAGMPGSAGWGIEFWLLARAVSAAALLVAAFAPRERTVGRRVRGWAVLAALALAALGYWLAVADPLTLPATYVPGRGLTPFKVGCEVVLIALNALAALFLLRRALVTGLRTDRYLAATAAVMALGGVSFASYARPDDVVNLVGHEGERVAEWIEVLAHIVPDPVAAEGQIWQFQQLFHDVGVQQVMVFAGRLQVLCEQYKVAARLHVAHCAAQHLAQCGVPGGAHDARAGLAGFRIHRVGRHRAAGGDTRTHRAEGARRARARARLA